MESKPINIFLAMEVLADIWGREHGMDVKITLTPKDETVVSESADGG